MRRALRAMRGGLVIGAGGALHGARIVCDAMRCARAGCIRAVGCDARDAQADALRGSMRCELFAMQYDARWLVAFARCRRHHAFDGGILRVRMGGFKEWADGMGGGMGGCADGMGLGMGGGMGLRVGFININDMYNNYVGKGVVYAYEAYEAK